MQEQHGKHKTRTYVSWCAMKQRCLNPHSKFFAYYGGRGITVCERWLSFSAFLADMGDAPDGCTLDRIDNDAGYGPENCRWATRSEQQNNRRGNVRITHAGKTLTIAEWETLTGIHHNTITDRFRRGLPSHEVFAQGKYHNLSGLKLGGLANGARKKAQTHCPHGHEFTTANTGYNKFGHRKCKACCNAREKRRTAQIRASADVSP